MATRKDEEEVEDVAISEEDVKAVREKMSKVKLSKDIEQIKYLMANFHNATSPEAKLAILEDDLGNKANCKNNDDLNNRNDP